MAQEVTEESANAVRIPQNYSRTTTFLREEEAGSVIIEAVDVNLDENMLSPTLNAFIFGHRVSISGRLRVQIRNLCVH